MPALPNKGRRRFHLPLRQTESSRAEAGHCAWLTCTSDSPQSHSSAICKWKSAASSSTLRVDPYLFWMDLDSQPLCPTIWVMFFASHQALLSGKRASLFMGGGAARSSAGKRAPSTNHNIMASSAKILQLETESKALAGKKTGKPAHFSNPMAVLGCGKHRYVLPARRYSHLPLHPLLWPGRLPKTLHGEWDMLLCLFLLHNKLWGRQIPALLLPGFVPGATVGFFHHCPPKAGLGEVCKTKASPPRAEPGWRRRGPQKCFYLRKEKTSPLPFLPP